MARFSVIRKPGKGTMRGPVNPGTRTSIQGTVVGGTANDPGGVVAKAHAVGNKRSIRNMKGGS